MKNTLKEKLGVDFRNYAILEACNPPFAHRALQSEPNIGIMLPCNVVVQDAEEGKTKIAVVNPVSAIQGVDNDEMGDIAKQIQAKLKSALEKV